MNITTSHRIAAAWALAIAAASSGCGGQEIDAARGPVLDAGRAADPAAARPARDAAAAARSATDPDLAGLAAQVAQLRQDVADLRRQVGQAAGVPRSRASAPPDPRTDPDAKAQARRTEQSRMAAAESAFRGEGVDASWSRETADKLGRAFSPDGGDSGSRVRSIECRSQTCRVEFAPVGGGAPPVDLPHTLMRLAATLPRTSAGRIDLGDGLQATVLYLSR